MTEREGTVTEPDSEANGPAPGSVHKVLRWLRQGYPDGVPQQDYIALLGILQRSLTPTELAHVVDELSDEAAAEQQLLTRHLVQQRIADVVKGPIDEEDVVRVSSRLAAAGWPLGSPLGRDGSGRPEGETGEARPGGVVGRVVDWLRVGYPTGLPAQDFVPLVALLLRRLSDDEVRAVGRLLAESGAMPDRVDIGTAIATVTNELPSDADVERVRAYLAGHGWPVDLEQ